MEYKIGQLVTRKSYNNDIVFEIMKVEADIYYLKGINVRLIADSYADDLVLVNKERQNIYDDEECIKNITTLSGLDRNDFFYLPAKVVHFDCDEIYMKRCLNFYKSSNVTAYGVYLKYENLAKEIPKYLEELNPNIIVITGHDSYLGKRREGIYQNSNNFLEAVKVARKYEKDPDKLVIIAGACQSNYEELIKAGANFASSPKRINIHALDPAIVASLVAFSVREEPIDLIGILSQTKYGADGIGGIKTNGMMYIGYPRKRSNDHDN